MMGHILSRMPENIQTYYEPFIGGGAIFFELARQGRFQKAVIGDLNEELMNTYQTIRSHVNELVTELNIGDYKYSRSNFLRIRAIDPTALSLVQRAARFIYLNRTCFNGLYRVNSKGQFNTPFGAYKNPVICDEPNLRAASTVLQSVEILAADFEVVLSGAAPGDVVYMDPPYLPTSETSKFTAYNTGGFLPDDHRRLAACFERLVGEGVCCVLSNSYAPLTIELFGKHQMTEHMGARVVGGPAEYRKPAREIIVSGGPGN